MEKVILGAGCFWGVENFFRQPPGVFSTSVGYSGGYIENPSYESVCNGNTGHTEVVEIEYNPTQISFEHLLNLFWANHNPTHKMKDQYKSVIFYFTSDQKSIAEQLKEQLTKRYEHEIRTQILPAQAFYKAEEYHQAYYEKRRQQLDQYLATCQILDNKLD